MDEQHLGDLKALSKFERKPINPEDSNLIEEKTEATFVSANILKTGIESTGYQGGDAGHGGFTTITFKDEASTCMDIEINGKKLQEKSLNNKIKITFRGDTEQNTLLQALKFLTIRLEEVLND